MTITNAIKKLEKATGNKVTQKGIIYSVFTGFYVIEFLGQSNGNITCISICRKGLKSCSLIDYFPETYCDNISQALRLAN
jgi:hypothetical protein